MSANGKQEEDAFILDRLGRYGVRRVEWVPGAPKAPPEGTPAYLDFLDRHAAKIVLGHPEAPVIIREGDRFVLQRESPERKTTRYKSMRAALKKVVFELSLKDAGTK